MPNGQIADTAISGLQTVLGVTQRGKEQGPRPSGERTASIEDRISSLGADILGTSIFFFVLFLIGFLIVWREDYLSLSAELQSTNHSILELCALACMGVGGLMGFLFGIPKILQGQKQPVASGSADSQTAAAVNGATNLPVYQQSVNTNLEEISDWLTKIIVGLGLANIGQIPHWLSHVADYIVAGTGSTSKAFVSAVVVYNVTIGFLFGYLLTRLALQRAFARADQAAAAQREDNARRDSLTVDIHSHTTGTASGSSPGVLTPEA